jgi:excisionase family DNA binding protein
MRDHSCEQCVALLQRFFRRVVMLTYQKPAGVEPLVVTPREACALLNIGNTRLYRLLSDKQIDSYREGRARRIPMASIKSYIARCLAESMGRRGPGRPRKHPVAAAATGQEPHQAEASA